MQPHYHLYRDLFTPSERAMLDASPPDSSLSEICLLRIQLRRTFEAKQRKDRDPRPGRSGEGASSAHRPSLGHEAQGPPTRALERHLSMLAVFSWSAVILASLVRYRHTHAALEQRYDPNLEDIAVNDVSEL